MRFLLALVLITPVLVADTLDYSRYTIVVTKVAGGALESSTAAELNRRALSVLEGAAYDRTWNTAAFLAAHPAIQRRLARLPLNVRQSEPRYLSDGTVTIDYEYDMCGPIMRLLMPPTGEGELLGRRACPCCGQEWPANREPPAGVRLEPYEEESGVQYSGILIDCQGLDLKPALFPCVVTEQGNEVMGPGFSTPENIAAAGLFARFRSRNEAFASERLGPNPLVIRAIGVTGTNQCDPIVTRQDAARIHGSRHNLELLNRCRIGLLTD